MTICLDVLKDCDQVGIIMEAVAEETSGAGTLAWKTGSLSDPPRGPQGWRHQTYYRTPIEFEL